MRRTESKNLLVFVVVKAEPVFDPTVNPVNVIAPADAPLVMRISTAQSDAGLVIVNAPLLVTY